MRLCCRHCGLSQLHPKACCCWRAEVLQYHAAATHADPLPAIPPTALPAGVGVVAENGQGASKFAVGQRVVGTPFDSVHGEQVA